MQKLLGNSVIRQLMETALQKGLSAHTYIVAGEKGLGKKTFVRELVTGLLLKQDPSKERLILSMKHPDLKWMEPEDARVFKVDEVRDKIVNDVSIRPFYEGMKIYVISGAEKLSVSAQNALLKVLEEPPLYAYFFLLTERLEALLPTIQSRAVLLTMRPLSESELMEGVKDLPDLREEDVRLALRFAGGNLGLLKELLKEGRLRSLLGELTSFLRSLESMKTDTFVRRMKEMTAEDFPVDFLFYFLTVWYRDVLTFKATKDMNLLIFQEEYKALRETASHKSYGALEHILESLDEAKRRLDANVNQNMVLELLFLNMKEVRGPEERF